MSILINMEMPQNCSECAFCGYYGNGEHMCDIIEKAVEYESAKTSRRDDCPLIPVPEHGRLLKVLKTERECVSRDCDRNCGKCDLSLERGEILKAYNALIAMLDPADKTDCISYIPKDYPKPQTNADRIRQMTDEELANLLHDHSCSLCPLNYKCDGRVEVGRKKCKEYWLRWLKATAEVDNEDDTHCKLMGV